MRKFLALLIFASTTVFAQTTTSSLSTTVKATNVKRPGINFGGKTTYAQGQVFKDLMQNGGNVIGYYWQTAFECDGGGPVATITIATPGSSQTPGTYPVNATGGGGSGAIASITVDGTGVVSAAPTIFMAGNGYISVPTFTMPAGGTPATFTVTVGPSLNDTTHWFNGNHNSNGFPASFWSSPTSTYTAIHQNGTILGTGTVTANTDGTGTTGITFTLSPPLTAACTPGSNTANTDEIIIRQRGSSFGKVDANTKFQHSGTLAYSTDVDPASTNNQQSVNVSTGGDVHFYLDAAGSYPIYVASPTGPYTYINVNGPYTLTYRAKCLGSSGTYSYDLRRIGGAPPTGASGTDTSSGCSSTPGVGWQQFSHSFTGTETGNATTSLQFQIGCTSSGGSCDFQDMRIIEGTALPGGNPTAFRDAVVKALQKINPGTLRLMTPPSWCSDVNDQIAPLGQQRACGISTSNVTSASNSTGYDDFLRLCDFLGTEPYITLGHFNDQNDWVTMVNWLQSSGWNSVFAAKNQYIYLADGNETWNPGAVGEIDCGNGNCYGVLLGQKMAAARGASGYNSAVDKFIGNGWASKSQAYTTGGGWTNNVLTKANCTTGSANCPDYIEYGPYFLTNLTDPITSTSPFLDETAEIHNWDSVLTSYLTGNVNSMYAAQTFLRATFGIDASVYEESQSIVSGSGTPTQDQMNQISQGLHMALTAAEHALLMARDTGIYGPRNEFAFIDQPFISAINSTNQTSWVAEAYVAAGPGQISTWNDVAFPVAIVYQMVNQAIGNKSNMMNLTQSGTPTFNYPGGQNTSIVANSSVNYVETFLYSDNAGNYAFLAFNTDPVNSYPLVLSGSAAPPGGIAMKSVLSGNATDNNSTSVTANNPTQVVSVPTAASGTCAGTMPANSLTVCTYSLSSSSSSPFLGSGLSVGLGIKIQ